MYSFKDKWVNVNYVLNIRSPSITKNTLNSCSMVHAGISGVAMRKCIWGREWNVQVRRNTFSFKARCFRMYSMQIREVNRNHSVESPSMVDPQWNIWYWGSKWNLHTVCWSVVGCEWGTTFVYLGITYVCFIPSRLPVFAVEPQYLLQYFLFLPKVSLELHIQNRQKISCWFKIWMGFVGPILIKLWTSSIWGFL